MIKRVVGKEVGHGFFVNIHISTHKYFHAGIKVKFERVPCWIVGDCEIYSVDVHLFLFFVDVMLNVNKALKVGKMRKLVTEWELPRGTFRVEWKVTDRGEYWRVEGSNGEFFTVPKTERPTWKDVKDLLAHIYDDDVKAEWERHNNRGDGHDVGTA